MEKDERKTRTRKQIERKQMSYDTDDDYLFPSRPIKDHIRVVALIATANQPNVNGRIYSLELLQEISKSELSILGRIGNPEFSPRIDLSQVSHQTNKLWLDDLNLMAEIETLSTPQGEILQSVIDNNIRFYLNGTGMVNNNIVSDYKLISINAELK